jgi:ribonucleoside-diphosphate reductase alpha chain
MQRDVATAFSATETTSVSKTTTVTASMAAADAPMMDGNLALKADPTFERMAEARIKGYEGEACGECGNFTLVRNGTCMKCDTCGGTSGCS